MGLSNVDLSSLFFFLLLLQASAKELAESVDLLLQLQEPADSLCAEFLAHAETRLSEQLTVLEGLQHQVGCPISKISENLKMCFPASSYSSSILLVCTILGILIFTFS
jgi:hypothetical protein